MEQPTPRHLAAPAPDAEQLEDIIIGMTYNPDDGHLQTEILGCTPEEVALILGKLAYIRKRWWHTVIRSLTIHTRSGKSALIWGDRIEFIHTRPSRSA